jgi:hypothetical protein
VWLGLALTGAPAQAQSGGWPCLDLDGDGHALCVFGCVPAGGDVCGDCNDLRASVNPGAPEQCGNGRDDDCDGAVDEGVGGGGACDTGEPGPCSAGTLVCRSGTLQCERQASPWPEVCGNGVDDDCNGFPDGGDLACSPACLEDPFTDRDHDFAPDCRDNCPNVPNPSQQDFDRDRQGDACETGARLADVDRSGRVDGRDLAALARGWARTCPDPSFDRRVDLTRDCRVDGEDLAVLAAQFGRGV